MSHATRAIVTAILVAAPAVLAAQDAQDPLPPPPSTISWRGSVEWIVAARWTKPADTALNPDNARLRIPQLWMQIESRPNVRVELGSRVTAVIRPRALANVEGAWASNLPRHTDSDASVNWTELYVNWRPNDVVQLTYGLQNFQWGPSELLAPSNRIFHETGAFRDQLYYVRGRHLLRANLSAGRQWSVVALAELSDNGEDPFVAHEPFRRQGQVKLEYADASGRGYIGVTAGGREDSHPWFGGYGSIELTEGLSAYADTSLTKGSRAWYPVAVPGGATFQQRDIDASSWRTLAVAGLRYTFVAGQDVRVEVLHQGAGYTRNEFDLAALAAGTATTAEAFAPYISPGLEFTGRRFGLVSVLLPDLPPLERLTLQGRYLRSFTDGSGVAFVTASLEAADAVVVFASASTTHGRETAEFSRIARAGAVAGAVWTW